MSSEKRNKAIARRQEKQKEELLEQLKKTPIVQFVCKRVGVGRTTYYRWLKDDDAFAEAAEEAMRDGISIINDMIEAKLIASAREGNNSAGFFWLKHRHPAYTTRVELTTKQKPIDKLSPEQELAIKKALELAGLLQDKKDNRKTS